MPFQTGTANSPSDLQTVIETFCQAHGWTLTSGVLSKGSIYVRLTTPSANELRIEGALDAGFTSLCPQYARIFNTVWPVAYWIFAHASPDTVLLVVRYNVSEFRWLGFGTLEKKVGSWTGGEWFAASHSYSSTSLACWSYDNGFGGGGYPQGAGGGSGTGAPFWKLSAYTGTHVFDGNSFLHCELDSVNWLYDATYPTAGLGYAWIPDAAGELLRRQPSAWNSEPVLVPLTLHMPRADSKFSELGSLAHLRVLKINYHEPGDVITLGSDTWMVFPFIKKNSTYPDNEAYNADSGCLGWAIKYDGP